MLFAVRRCRLMRLTTSEGLAAGLVSMTLAAASRFLLSDLNSHLSFRASYPSLHLLS